MSEVTALQFDVDACANAIKALYQPGEIIEMRAPEGRPHVKAWERSASGYYDGVDKLVEDAERLSGHYSGVYVVLNPIDPNLLARSANHITFNPKVTTGDSHVTCRRWLYLDFDPIRTAGISATDEEQRQAFDVARECREWLTGQGWPDPIRADSGNGAHLLYRIDLPNDENSLRLINSCLKALAFRFGTDGVDIDQQTGNASRLVKLYGTLACKGDAIPDRPHRIARAFIIPESMSVVPTERLDALASMAPQEPDAPSRRRHNGQSGFDLERWIDDHGLDVAKNGPWSKGHKWILSVCPWNPEHTDWSAYIVQIDGGGISAGCHHNGCAGREWHDLRDVVEPGWRDRKEPENDYK